MQFLLIVPIFISHLNILMFPRKVFYEFSI